MRTQFSDGSSNVLVEKGEGSVCRVHPYQNTNLKMINLNAPKGKYLKQNSPIRVGNGRRKIFSMGKEGERNLRSSRAHSASLSHMLSFPPSLSAHGHSTDGGRLGGRERDQPKQRKWQRIPLRRRAWFHCSVARARSPTCNRPALRGGDGGGNRGGGSPLQNPQFHL